MAEEITARIREIKGWDRAQCLDAWTSLTGTDPGSRLSPKFLRRALIFELQCKKLGGHSASIRRLLRTTIGSAPTPVRALTPGTQLVREWNGRVYRVDVTAHAFEMDGQSYPSLSAIAKRITGAEWSGPRFFGLKKRNP
jgi:hypothetical protein